MTALRAALVIVALSGCGSEKESGTAGGAAAPPAPTAGPTLEVSKPTRASVAALAKVKQPRALLFLEAGPVADQVVGYLGDLARQAGVSLEVRELDRLTAPDEARTHKVAADALVLVSGDHSERISLTSDPAMGAKVLAGLDAEVGRRLTKLARDTSIAALVRQPVSGVDRFSLVDQALRAAGFAVSTVTPGQDVPAGALALVLDSGDGTLAPAIASIDKHLAAGGSALVALEPARGATLGPLAKRIGVELGEGVLADDKEYMVRLHDDSDRGLILTNGFAAHPSVATLARARTGSGTLFIESGHLVETGPAPPGVTRVVAIKSMTSSFVDVDGDHRRDAGEAPQAHPIAIAVTIDGGGGAVSRAMVVADASWLTDDVLRQLPTAQQQLFDAIRWLGGEEAMSEETGVPALATGDQLTSYPARAAPAPVAAAAIAPIWEVAPADVRAIRYTDGSRTILVERRDGALWARVERNDTGGGTTPRDFPLSPEGDALFAQAARPLPLRALGALDDARAASYELGPATLTVEHAGGSHTLELGGRVFGGSDRYVADRAQKRAFIIAHAMLDVESIERLAVRKPVGMDEDALTRLVIARSGKTREATRAADGTWTVAGGTGDQAFAVGVIAQSALRLAPVEFAVVEPKGLAPAATLTFTATGPAVALEIFTGPGDTYWIRSPLTHVHGRVPTTSAARVVDAIAQVIP